MQAHEPVIDLYSLTAKDIKTYEFVDVREDVEIMTAPVNAVECIHLPLSGYDGEISTFDLNKKYIIFCAHGIRSGQLALYLRNKGLNNVFSLNQSAEEIDAYLRKTNA